MLISNAKLNVCKADLRSMFSFTVLSLYVNRLSRNV